MLEPHADRVTWDAPLHSVADIEALERKPKAINSKPSRFGSLRELSRSTSTASARGSPSTAAGRARLGVGREQIQYLASLFHPDTPNDVAPSGYNDPSVPDGLPTSPLEPAARAEGLPLGGLRFGMLSMAEKSFPDALNEQIANEFAASQQYVGAAVHYDAETLPRLAAFFYRQAIEERDHAMMMVQYLLDVDEEVRIPDIESKQSRYDDDVAPVRMALEQEKVVGEEIYALFELARETKDYRAEQFMQWFVKEQVEEVALMHDLLRVVERSSDNILLVEDFLARENLGAEDDPSRAARRRREPLAQLVTAAERVADRRQVRGLDAEAAR